MNDFWSTLPKPISILSPMEGVTDTVMRQSLCDIARPDIFFTEFINVDGLVSSFGLSDLRLKFAKIEKPIVAQLWGNEPENFHKSVKIIKKLGFDGIDINFGCADKDVVKNGCGAGLIENFEVAKEIIQATKDADKGLPISVKTRLGANPKLTQEWIQLLLEQKLSAITIHGRNRKENYLTPANWEEIGHIVEWRNKLKAKTLIIGNGDVVNYQDGLQKVDKYQTDGFAIARGILHDPWAFGKTQINEPSIKDRLKLLEAHAKLFEQTWGQEKSFSSFKKYIKMYIQNFLEAAKLRNELMLTNDYKQLIREIKLIH